MTNSKCVEVMRDEHRLDLAQAIGHRAADQHRRSRQSAGDVKYPAHRDVRHAEALLEKEIENRRA